MCSFSRRTIMNHHSYSERMHRLSVVYAMMGLFFGCLSAGLIIVASIRSISRIRTVVVFAPMEQVQSASSAVSMDKSRGLRGYRRLTDEVANEVSVSCTLLFYHWEGGAENECMT